ncbi:hypothetical protein DER46DRAFT_580667 [Fusarium sp. MPI-SDFR-AT-0072]|nr:hypothetical protein DER46DRAFT_580667 [Fusarium sp. MPI-SDFR-AT-0072]
MFSSIAGKSIGAQFLDEAKKLLDLENGRASLPTMQGLTLLFTLSAYQGMDRACMMYRLAAYEMFRRLHLDRTFNNIKVCFHRTQYQDAFMQKIGPRKISLYRVT